MFQVMVVENDDEDHLRTASWAFPAYMMIMSLFVVPIAVVGLDLLPEGSNPDLFVLTVPLATGNEGLAVLSFLGGFSSATSMVIGGVDCGFDDGFKPHRHANLAICNWRGRGLGFG